MKQFILAISVSFAMLLVGGCANNTGEVAISGVSGTLEINQNEPFHALEGVSAVDGSGKDITDQIIVTLEPAVIDENNVFTIEEAGDYLVKYSLENHPDIIETSFLTVKKVSSGTANLVKEYKFNEISDEAFNGFSVNHELGAEGNLTIDQGKLVYTTLKQGKNELVYHFPLLGANTNQEIGFAMSASQEMLVNIKVVDEVTNDVLAVQENVKITDVSQLVTLEFNVSDIALEQAKVVVELVESAGNSSLAIHSMTQKSFANPQTSAYNFENGEDLMGWLIETPGQDQGSAIVENGSLVYAASPFSENPWENKIWRNDFKVEKGKTYQLLLSVEANQDMTFTFILKNGDPALVWSQHELKTEDGEKQYSYMFTAEESTDAEVILELGGQGNTGEGKFKFNELEVTTFDSFEESTVKFSGVAGVNSFEMEPAISELYIDTTNNKLVYDITEFGAADWHNKIYIDKDVIFKEGARYKVDITIASQSEMKGLFAVNPVGTWSPKIVAELNLTEAVQTLSFETDKEQVFDQDMEILFQFGGQDNVGPNAVYISNISIYEIK